MKIRITYVCKSGPHKNKHKNVEFTGSPIYVMTNAFAFIKFNQPIEVQTIVEISDD